MIYFGYDIRTGMTYALYDGVLIQHPDNPEARGKNFFNRLAHHLPAYRNWPWHMKIRCTFQRQISLLRFGTVVSEGTTV
jgi:hypothetical protein